MPCWERGAIAHFCQEYSDILSSERLRQTAFNMDVSVTITTSRGSTKTPLGGFLDTDTSEEVLGLLCVIVIKGL